MGGVFVYLLRRGAWIETNSIFQFSLLHKWRWRILGGSDALRYKVLKARYGDINLHVVSFDGNCKRISKSFWWKDIISLEKIHNVNMFANNCRFFIGNGYNTSFWQAK